MMKKRMVKQMSMRQTEMKNGQRHRWKVGKEAEEHETRRSDGDAEDTRQEASTERVWLRRAANTPQTVPLPCPEECHILHHVSDLEPRVDRHEQSKSAEQKRAVQRGRDRGREPAPPTEAIAPLDSAALP